MCGILFMPRASSLPYDYVLDVMRRLESKRGGDGNGIWHNDGSGWKVSKGEAMRVEDAARMAVDSRGAALFHTRKVSVGSKSSVNCHPFRVQWVDSDGVLVSGAAVHNGTFSEAKAFKPQLVWDRIMSPLQAYNVSDTGVVAKWIERVGPDFLWSLPMGSGCWIYAEDGSNEAIMHAYGNIVQAEETKWGWLYASDGGLLAPQLEPERGDIAILTPKGPNPVGGCKAWGKVKTTYTSPPTSYKGKTTYRMEGNELVPIDDCTDPWEKSKSSDYEDAVIKAARNWKLSKFMDGGYDKIIRGKGIIPTDIGEVEEALWGVYQCTKGFIELPKHKTDSAILSEAISGTNGEFLQVVLLHEVADEVMRNRAFDVAERCRSILKGAKVVV